MYSTKFCVIHRQHSLRSQIRYIVYRSFSRTSLTISGGTWHASLKHCCGVDIDIHANFDDSTPAEGEETLWNSKSWGKGKIVYRWGDINVYQRRWGTGLLICWSEPLHCPVAFLLLDGMLWEFQKHGPCTNQDVCVCALPGKGQWELPWCVCSWLGIDVTGVTPSIGRSLRGTAPPTPKLIWLCSISKSWTSFWIITYASYIKLSK